MTIDATIGVTTGEMVGAMTAEMIVIEATTETWTGRIDMIAETTDMIAETTAIEIATAKKTAIGRSATGIATAIATGIATATGIAIRGTCHLQVRTFN